jgi:hypothetical protein
LYFSLNFYFPDKFNEKAINPVELDKQRLFGQPVQSWLAFTQVQFYKMPRYLQTLGLKLSINNKNINTFYSFVSGNISSGFDVSYENVIASVHQCVDGNIACAIDIPVKRGIFVLQDHVMFVYGYDDDNLYVFDTLTVKNLGYTKVEGEDNLYVLPKSLIRDNWSHFGRFWKVEKIS